MKKFIAIDFETGSSKSISARVSGYVVVLFLVMFASFAQAADAPSLEKQLVRKVVVGKGDNGTVLSISDIHFNPFENPEMVPILIHLPYHHWEFMFSESASPYPSTYRQESNYALLDSMVDNIPSLVNPDFILFSGDILAHNFNETFKKYSTDEKELREFIKNTVGYVSWKVSQAFPETPIYFTLGNNDSYLGDYRIADNGKFLKDTADILFNNFIQRDEDKSRFYLTYPKHGYYSVNQRHGGLTTALRLIVLNATYFSRAYDPPKGTDPGGDQMKWFESMIEHATGNTENVWILLHIPPGVDVFSTGKSGDVKLHWKQKYNQKFLDIVNLYNVHVKTVFTGHTHMDDYRLHFTKNKYNKLKYVHPIHSTPGISPIFGNNPGFQVLTYKRKTGEIVDHATYYLDVSEQEEDIPWRWEYGFLDEYGQTEYVKGLENLYDKMPYNQGMRDKYIEFYSVDVTEPLIEDSWKKYRCGIKSLTLKDYKKHCMGR
jgi:sphingomyelin phosphodiesterase acid-like 3